MAKQTPSRLLSLYDFFAPKKPRYDDDESVTYEEEAVEQTSVSETDSPSLLCDSDSDNDELNESKTAAVSQPVFMMEESAPSSFSLIPVSTTLPNDIAVTSKSSPVQPTGVRFPDTSFSGKKRSFNPLWYQKHKWIEYSIKNDAIFCFPCRFFVQVQIFKHDQKRHFLLQASETGSMQLGRVVPSQSMNIVNLTSNLSLAGSNLF